MHELCFCFSVCERCRIRRRIKNNPLEPDPKTAGTEELLNSVSLGSGSPNSSSKPGPTVFKMSFAKYFVLFLKRTQLFP